jgi:hypothetical protein
MFATGFLLLVVCLIAPDRLGLNAHGRETKAKAESQGDSKQVGFIKFAPRDTPMGGAGVKNPDPDYDILDGRGETGARVDVIEWEGNLEVHVYPRGRLVGMGMKIDRKNEKKPVMVIAYRFTNDPKKKYIRRHILSIPMQDAVRVYKDPSSGDEYDKFIVTNNELAGSVVAYRTDEAPAQLYPDGHPAVIAGVENPQPRRRGGKLGTIGGADLGENPDRTPAASPGGEAQTPASTPRPLVDENGTLLNVNFDW